MKTFFKFMFRSILIAIIIIIVAVIAAPHFIRQDQVVAFIEDKVKLPGNSKLKIQTPVEFGFFPYAHISAPLATLTSADGITKKFENILFGFDFNSLITKNIDFDLETKFEGVDYKANVGIGDYSKFLNSEDTDLDIKVENPVPFTLKGVLKTTSTGKELKNFVLTHKQTVARGNITFQNMANGVNGISGSVVLDTENIDDLRRLADKEHYNDPYSRLSGKGKAVLSFATAGTNDYQYKRNLNAEGSMKINDAVIYGIDMDEFLRSFGQTKLSSDASKMTPIDAVDLAFVSNRGVANISNFKMYNKKGTATGTGTIDIADEKINSNLNINAEVEGNSANLPLQISGNLKDPSVRPLAVQAVITNAASLQQLTGQIKNEKVRDTLKSVFDVLGGFGGGTQQQPQAQQPAPAPNQQ